MLLISSGWGGGKVGSRRGSREGAELEGENKRGGGVRGYFTAPEGLVGVGEQCGNVTLLANICVCTRRYGGMHT